jgi:conjugative transfer region protein TrbK
MNIGVLVRGVAVMMLAGALLATAITLKSNSKYPEAEVRTTRPLAGPSGAPESDFARCNAVGADAANDADCKAVWAEHRKRFFASGAAREDRPSDPLPATPNTTSMRVQASGATPRHRAPLTPAIEPGSR